MSTQLQYTPGTFTARASYGAQATAATTDSWPILRAQHRIKVVGARVIPAADVTGANTNNFALAVQNKGDDGEGSTAVTATKTYASGTDSNAHEPEELTLSTTDDNLVVAAGDELALVRTVNGDGLASPDGVVEIDYQFYGVG